MAGARITGNRATLRRRDLLLATGVCILLRGNAFALPTGQIYVTRGVRDQLSGHPDLRFEAKGERRVKNIDRPIRVYRVDR